MLFAVFAAALALLVPKPATLIAAGDVASCRSSGDEATAALVAKVPGTVAVLGDIVYERGTAAELARCYSPSWGRFRKRTRPALGNHDYGSGSAAPALAYFGLPRSYYSYELGAWHAVVLDSNCWAVGGCGAGSPQERWLRADLAAHPARCTLAYWHHPRFSSGYHGSDATYGAFWRALYEADAEIVLNGHDHHYERFAKQNPSGKPDPGRGIREFVVGTGGRSLYGLGRPENNSAAFSAEAFGVL